jgi:threonine dehydrogenase-like Zn-dependent dehydrogenase
VVVTPGVAGSGRLEEVPDAEPIEGQVVVDVLEVGVCGTDAEILHGLYGTAPEGDDYLIIGHENFGRVASAPPGSGFEPGDLVACQVRRPDPVPCVACAAGRQDLCTNGQYTERGIKGRHGFMADRYVEWPEFLVPVPAGVEAIGVLLEPLSVVEKGVLEAEAMQRRIPWEPREAVVTGAGPIGLMAALLLRSRGMEVWVVDRNPRGGLKSEVVEATGAHYVQSDEMTLPELAAQIDGIDLFVEATAVPEIVFSAIDAIGPNGVLCLTGVSAGSRTLEVPGAQLNLEMVLENKVVFGTVNASRRDWEAAARDLPAFESAWPGLCSRLLTRRVPAERYAEVLERERSDIKNTVLFSAG